MDSHDSGDRKRRKKYIDETHRKNAEKQALWRRRHPDKYEARKERMRMESRINRGQHRPGGYLLYEIWDENGAIVDVVVRAHYKAAPKGAQLSNFLPRSPLDYWLAIALRDARLKQLAEWRGER